MYSNKAKNDAVRHFLIELHYSMRQKVDTNVYGKVKSMGCYKMFILKLLGMLLTNCS